MITHTIVSWDSSFRNFFHLIDAMLTQDYDRNAFELIYVEQRSRGQANAYNHALGLKSLEDRYYEVKEMLNMTLVYLDDPPDVPYHLGRSVNRGLAEAKGKYISVLDGDLLLPENFLSDLERYHESGGTVVNLDRRMASRPAGASLDNWTEGAVDFQACLDECPDRDRPVPEKVSNKGPLISASRQDWNAVDGYDEHPVWSTGLSRLGQDVNARLEIHGNVESTALPNCFAVHPYHPAGFSRQTLDAVRLLAIQSRLIRWSQANRKPSWRSRTPQTDRVFEAHRTLVERVHNGEVPKVHPGSSEFLGKIYQRWNSFLHRFPTS